MISPDLVEQLRNLELQQPSPNMALWQRLSDVPDSIRRLREVYADHFPLEVRHFLSEWIEAQPWFEILQESQDRAQLMAEETYNNLMTQLTSKIQEMQQMGNMDMTGLFGLRLEEYSTFIQKRYSTSPLEFVQVMCHLLTKEKSMVETALGPPAVDPAENDSINSMLFALAQFTKETDELQRKEQHEQENFFLKYQDHHRLTLQLQQLEAQGDVQKAKQLEPSHQESLNALKTKMHMIGENRKAMRERFENVVDQLASVQSRVLDVEMISWKKRQALAGNGAPFDNNIDKLQKWCEDLASLIWQNRQMIKKMIIMSSKLPLEDSGAAPQLEVQQEKITKLLSSLVTSTFLVETQPPQVLKKDACFSTSVRLLVGGQLNVYMNPPVVEASIINEKQARELLENDPNARKGCSGEIINNQAPMEYNQVTSVLSVNFKNMKLKKIKRAEKKSAPAENVTGEKFCILFQSKFNIGGNELFFQVWTLSQPIVVIVHGNQECAAMATILWDNAFAEPGRVPFVVPECTMWSQMAVQLDHKFRCLTGRGLTQEQLNFIASKILGSGIDYSKATISRAQFHKDNIPGRNFKFWDWVYGILKLIRDYIKPLWNDGAIMGFVGKIEAQEKLFDKPNGTFLLRFSESEIGGITIAWVMEDPVKLGHREVWNLVPFTEADFKKLGLADRIRDLGQLVYLYPAINKSQAFGKYYTPSNSGMSSNGYIQAVICNKVIMPESSQRMALDNPQTPLGPTTLESTPPMDSDSDDGMDLTAGARGDRMNSESCTLEEIDVDDLGIACDYTTEDILNIIMSN